MSHTAPSLWRHLWWWVLGTTTAVWLTLAGVAFYTGHHEAGEIAEGQLESVALQWLNLPAEQWPPQAQVTARRDAATLTQRHAAYTTEWAVLLWEGTTLRLDSHGLAGHLPARLRPGSQRVTLSGLPGDWRLWVQDSTDSPTPRRVVVGVPMKAQNALGRDIAEHIVRPALVLLPLVALLLAWALQRGLSPVRRLAHQVAALDLHGGQHLPEERRFAEVEGTVNAINTLVKNLQDQVQRERGFASDVAHEMRTPLTALVWQARLAQDSTDPAERTRALQQVEQDALRAGRILAQLLDLARAQGLNAQSMVPVVLADVAARVLADHAQAAFEGGRELALQDDAPGQQLNAHPLMLELALRNLVDNALRHTPPGTQVRVRTWRNAGEFGVDVVDDGGGPAPTTTPSTSPHNLGIGLTLVRRIAAQHGAQLLSAPPTPPWTHGWRIVWPATGSHKPDPQA